MGALRQKVNYNTALSLTVASNRCRHGKYKNVARI